MEFYSERVPEGPVCTPRGHRTHQIHVGSGDETVGGLVCSPVDVKVTVPDWVGVGHSFSFTRENNLSFCKRLLRIVQR